jgi:GDP-L-fucose synthase
MRADSLIYVAGHRGLVGSALVRRLRAEGCGRLVLRAHADLDLEDQAAVRAFFERERPEYVFLAAAKVGGILANASQPGDFIRSNLMVQGNVLEAAYRAGVRKLLFLGSSCIYPREAPQPIREEYLLTGPLEPTNAPYAVAKIAGITMCQAYNRQYGTNFISVMPTNLYGPGDNFEPQRAHVLPALLRRFHEAQRAGAPTVTVWGTGTPRREFLHVDDLADACVFLMARYDGSEPINVGCGTDVSIADLARLIAGVVGYEGEIAFDPSQPDGTPRKLLDASRLERLGWRARISLEAGVRELYAWFVAHPPAPPATAPR